MRLNKPSLQLTACAVLTAALSGCALTKKASPYYQPAPTPIDYISPSVAYQLSLVSAGENLILESSPLGANLSAIVIERYFAASGRDCVRMTPQSQPNQILVACRHDDKDWFWSRSFSQPYLTQE